MGVVGWVSMSQDFHILKSNSFDSELFKETNLNYNFLLYNQYSHALKRSNHPNVINFTFTFSLTLTFILCLSTLCPIVGFLKIWCIFTIWPPIKPSPFEHLNHLSRGYQKFIKGPFLHPYAKRSLPARWPLLDKTIFIFQ